MATSIQNPFDGKGVRAKFANKVYQQLMNKQWVSYSSIMTEVDPENIRKKGVSNCNNYSELKKAFPAVCKAIREKVGDNAIEERGNNRNREYRYTAEVKDPLSDMRNAMAIKDLGRYWEFCQDSAGFFPMSWLEDFFENSSDLLNIKTKKQQGEQVIYTSLDRILKNIDLLPSLYKKIKNKDVLYIDYKPYNEECRTLVFHPHVLKEYNGRWQLFGHAEGLSPEFGYNLSLDRIQAKPRKKHNTPYIPAPKNFYTGFFKDIVGVSHFKDETPQTIHIRAHKNYMFKLTETKPIHHSQKVSKPFAEYEDGEYGEFTVYVEVNNEFFGRILQMGADLEIVSPPDVREKFKQRIETMTDLYKDKI